jgi:hypothetical protein
MKDKKSNRKRSSSHNRGRDLSDENERNGNGNGNDRRDRNDRRIRNGHGDNRGDGNESSSSEGDIDSPPSFDTSLGSSSSFSSRDRGGSGTGNGSGGGCRLVDNHEGKIRPASSRDTVSTAATALSHFDNSSTGMMSQGSQNIRSGGGRDGRNRNNQRRLQQLRPSSRLFNRQLNILMSSTGISLILFLLAFLNIFAFTALMSFVTSLLMLLYTSYTYIMHLVQSGELNIFTLLPESIQNRLLNTSIHEMMTDDSGYIENRYLLLYLIPGLTPDQILSMVNRLPERHRNMVLGPGGMARMLLPSSISNSLVPSTADHTQPLDNQLALPVIEEGNEDPPEEVEVEISNRDALRGIFDTVRSLVTSTSADDGHEHEHDSVEEEELYVTAIPATNGNHDDFQDMSWENVESHEEEVHISDHVHNQYSDDESGDSDLGLDIDSNALTGNMQMSRLSRIARLLGLHHSTTSAAEAEAASTSSTSRARARATNTTPSTPPSTVTARSIIDGNQPRRAIPSSPSQQQTPTPIPPIPNPQAIEEEREIEGEIINDAIAAVMNNYYEIGLQGALQTASNVVEATAPVMIRAGTRLSSVSGLGLLGMLSSSMLSAQPVSVMGRSISSRNLTEGRSGRYAVRGLLSTFIFGVMTVGSAYLTRAFIRRQRDVLLKEKEDDDDDNAKKGGAKDKKTN